MTESSEEQKRMSEPELKSEFRAFDTVKDMLEDMGMPTDHLKDTDTEKALHGIIKDLVSDSELKKKRIDELEEENREFRNELIYQYDSCPECFEMNATYNTYRYCRACGYEFPKQGVTAGSNGIAIGVNTHGKDDKQKRIDELEEQLVFLWDFKNDTIEVIRGMIDDLPEEKLIEPDKKCERLERIMKESSLDKDYINSIRKTLERD